jgi:hypothetical protein
MLEGAAKQKGDREKLFATVDDKRSDTFPVASSM